MSRDRRDNLRVPQSRLITEIASENPFAAGVVNISSTGLYTVKPITSGMRGPATVQLEIPVPEASETIWTTGEIVFEAVGQESIGAGIRFNEMARAHKVLLADLVEHRRREILEEMLREIMWRKELALNPSPYAEMPPVGEDTVKMYLAPSSSY